MINKVEKSSAESGQADEARGDSQVTVMKYTRFHSKSQMQDTKEDLQISYQLDSQNVILIFSDKFFH